MIPQAFIDSLLQRVDVVEVVGAYVQLKKTGANYSGLCPFHTEKSPSFSVSPSKQFYHCFGCGAHGTAIGFVMEHLGISFPQAVEDLAGRVGLTVPQEQRDGRSEQDRAESRDQRARLLAQLSEAASFYKRRLRESPEAIAYLKRRGLTGEVAAQFMLGYSPAGWQSLQGVFADYAKPDLVDAGLVIQSSEGGLTKRYDRFRDRLMFPIRDERGEVIGFGARTLGQDEPKYLNSPETPVFSKGHHLYGLFEAKQAIRAAQACWVVEGYMDVISLTQAGVEGAVAPLGTALTESQIQLLWKLLPPPGSQPPAEAPVLCFDGDAAGQRAAAERRPGHRKYAALLQVGEVAVGEGFVRGEAELDLVGGEAGAHPRLQKRGIVGPEVRDADRAHLAGGYQRVEGRAGGVMVHQRIGPVQQEQIDHVGLQGRKGLVD